MSQVLINQPLGDLDRLKKIGGTHRESVVREAFKDLLKGRVKQHDQQFIPEYKLDSATKDTRSTQAVLIQHRNEVMRCDVTDVKALEKLLKLLFAFVRAEIADFRKAVAQFKTDLPAVLLSY